MNDTTRSFQKIETNYISNKLNDISSQASIPGGITHAIMVGSKVIPCAKGVSEGGTFVKSFFFGGGGGGLGDLHALVLHPVMTNK